jgi:chromosome segregation ATPase
MSDNENVHPNLYFISPSNNGKSEFSKQAEAHVNIFSPGPRFSTLSSRFSTCSIMDDGYVTASEPAMSVSPKRRKNSSYGQSDENSILSELTGVSRLHDEILQLGQQLMEKDEEIEELKKHNDSLQEHVHRVENERDMMKAELDMHNFIIGVQIQKINELEDHISTSRLEYHESITSKNKKMKQLTQKVEKEKVEHEKRANTMITQLNEQMGALQKMALTRIEALEKELMKERHKFQSLETENRELKLENDECKFCTVIVRSMFSDE